MTQQERNQNPVIQEQLGYKGLNLIKQSGGYSGCPALLVGTFHFIVLTDHQFISILTENSPLGRFGVYLSSSPEIAQFTARKLIWGYFFVVQITPRTLRAYITEIGNGVCT